MEESEPLLGIRLRTATGQEVQVRGKLSTIVTIGNIPVTHVFIVADITDAMILGLDFMIGHSFTLNLKYNPRIISSVISAIIKTCVKDIFPIVTIVDSFPLTDSLDNSFIIWFNLTNFRSGMGDFAKRLLTDGY